VEVRNWIEKYPYPASPPVKMHLPGKHAVEETNAALMREVAAVINPWNIRR